MRVPRLTHDGCIRLQMTGVDEVGVHRVRGAVGGRRLQPFCPGLGGLWGSHLMDLIDRERTAGGYTVKGVYVRLCGKFGETALGFPAVAVPVPPAIDPGVVLPPMSLPAKAAFQSETLFDFGKALIEPKAQAAFNAFACSISEPDHDVVITLGHTDAVGTAAFSQTLAEQRANAVRVYLIGQSLDAECIRSEGRGEREPIASNSIADGRMRNRRVEIEVRGN